jgi:DNA-directed RNA polymerase specialized sigma24 family protein
VNIDTLILTEYPRICRQLEFRGCRNPEDYVSEAVLIYYDRRPELDGNVGGWIYRVAWHKWVNDRRSLRSRSTVSGDAGSSGDGMQMFDIETIPAPEPVNLDEFIQTLPPKLQETAILLSKCPSGTEVGKSLGITRQAVNLRLKQIREHFNDFYGVIQP